MTTLRLKLAKGMTLGLFEEPSEGFKGWYVSREEDPDPETVPEDYILSDGSYLHPDGKWWPSVDNREKQNVGYFPDCESAVRAVEKAQHKK